MCTFIAYNNSTPKSNFLEILMQMSKHKCKNISCGTICNIICFKQITLNRLMINKLWYKYINEYYKKLKTIPRLVDVQDAAKWNKPIYRRLYLARYIFLYLKVYFCIYHIYFMCIITHTHQCQCILLLVEKGKNCVLFIVQKYNILVAVFKYKNFLLKTSSFKKY